MQVQVEKRSKKEVIHYPRLDTILMIEDAIQKSDNNLSKMQLWKKLPRSVMYQTFSLVLDYLQKSNKILITKEGKIVWIAGNMKLDKAIARGLKVI